MGEQNLARFGQEDPLANPLEQQRTADLLELLDLQRDRRMRQMQLLRCPGKGGGGSRRPRKSGAGVWWRFSWISFH